MRTRIAKLVSVAIFAMSASACGGGGGGSAAVPATASVLPASVATMTPASKPSATPSPAATAAANAVATPVAAMPADFGSAASALVKSQRSDGAIPYTATVVSPYFANIAATGAARTNASATAVQKYIAWYIARSHDANPWGIAGAIADYTILGNGALQSAGSADSIDSYAATFLTLVATTWQYGDATARAYVQSIHADVERIASAIDAVTDSDGFSWALPSYRVKYLMDASEVYAGLNDLATLRSGAYNDLAGSLAASQRAANLRAAILATYWSDARGTFAVAIDSSGTQTLPNPTDWQDAMVQLAPILHGVIAPSSATAAGIYARFNAAFPNWTALSKPDEYPWTSVAFVALQMNDTARASAYRSAADAGFSPSFAYPWYCAETGWYLRVLDGLIAPQTVAAD